MEPLVVALVAVIALAGSRASSLMAPHGFELPAGEVLGWMALGATASLFRPGTREPVLGLGALVLFPVAVRLGPAVAALLAAATVVVAGLGRVALQRWAGSLSDDAEDRSRGRWLERCSLAVLSTLAAGAVAVVAPSVGWIRIVAPAATAGVVLMAVTAGLDRWRGDSAGSAWWVPVWDVAGWLVGGLLQSAAEAGAGWSKVAPLGVAFALLAAEAARHAMLRGVSDVRRGSLERLQLAHERILTESGGMGGIASQILTECRNVLPVAYFQLEVSEEGLQRSWTAGPDGQLERGRPSPPAAPPPLPGIHRRAEWNLLEGPLEAEGQRLATVRLWCDPRVVEPGAEALFFKLVPQMASAVHRARLDREAKLDPLTQVPVRRVLDGRLQVLFRRAYEEGRSLAVVMCDIDHFKRINDTWGHAAGDAALVLVARTLDQNRRDDDLCCRFGGEEFTLLLADTPGSEALELAERLRRAVEGLDFLYEGEAIALRLSAGVASFPELHVKTASELLLLADEALYGAKEAGRNRAFLHLGGDAFRDVEGDGPRPDRPAPKAPRFFA